METPAEPLPIAFSGVDVEPTTKVGSPSPIMKCTTVSSPFGLALPFSVAPPVVMPVAPRVWTVGGAFGVAVVKLAIEPLLVPAVLVATTR